MDVCVELLADDVWDSEHDKTGFLSVGVDIFNPLYLIERPISLPMVPTSIIKRKYENVDIWKISTNQNMRFFLMNDQNIMFGYTPPQQKNSKNRKCQSINFDECPE